MPVGPFTDAASCEVEMRGRYDSPDKAHRVCEALAGRRTEGLTFTEAEIADVERELDIVPLTEASLRDEIVVEAMTDPEGKTFEVTVIKAGVSKKKVNWRPSVLAEAVAMYERAPVGINDRGDHEEDSGDPRDIVGWLDNVRVVGEAIKATLHIIESAATLRESLVRAFKEGRPPGLSHVVRAIASTVAEGIRDVQKIVRVEFVDIVGRPSAGGQIETLVAGEPNEANKTPLGESQVPGEVIATPTPADAEAIKKLTEGVAAATAASTALTERVAKAESRALVAETLSAADLPDAAKKVLRERFDGRTLTESELKAELDSARKLIDASAPAGRAPGAARVENVVAEYDRMLDGMTEGLFGVKTKIDGDNVEYSFVNGRGILNAPTHPQRSSQKYWMERFTGKSFSEAMADRSTGGNPFKAKLLTESLTSATWDQAMADSITRALQAMYRQSTDFGSWRNFSQVAPVFDFRTQRRIRIGGYGDLATVAQGAAYAAVTTPTDEEATYAPTKRGGTEDWTLETQANDDVSSLRRIPVGMGIAAARTLQKFVYDFMRTNANVSYEAVALAASGHNNLMAVTDALSRSTLIAGINKMLKQVELTSAERIGSVSPKYLAVPIDLADVAYELTTAQQKPQTAENDFNYIRTYGIEPLVVKYWTDSNDWWLIADPATCPTIEVGFFNGNQEPELFIQDNPLLGANFTNDKTTLKLRHIYGGAVLDHRSFVGAIIT